jgi:type IV secretory pathway VirB4 component
MIEKIILKIYSEKSIKELLERIVERHLRKILHEILEKDLYKQTDVFNSFKETFKKKLTYYIDDGMYSKLNEAVESKLSKLIESPTFIDDVVASINRKQLGGK